MRAAIYVRISKDTEGRSLGVARQEADCRALIEARGWEVAGVWSDNDRSAYSGKPRPGYEAMLAELAAGRVQAIVAWHPDRLQRSPRELEDFIDAVEGAGAEVATVQAGKVDLSSAAGRMTARVVGAVARHESEQKSERLRRKARELAEAGKVGGGGLRPFGFEPDRVTVREEEAAVVRAVVARLLAGESMRGVTAWLNESGVPTVSGVPWRTLVVRRMVRSGRIAGRREHRGRVIGDAQWPAIVDPDDWGRLRARLDATSVPRGPGRRYLLTGIAVCGMEGCGALLVARPKADGRKCLVCARGVDNNGCGKIRQLAEPLDRLVVLAVVAKMDTLKVGRVVEREPAGTGVEELALIEARRAELAEAWADGALDDLSWAAARRRLDEREAALVTVAEPPLSTPWAGSGADLLQRWSSLHIDQQRAIVAASVASVVVGPAVKGRNFFDPDRVDIHWR